MVYDGMVCVVVRMWGLCLWPVGVVCVVECLRGCGLYGGGGWGFGVIGCGGCCCVCEGCGCVRRLGVRGHWVWWMLLCMRGLWLRPLGRWWLHTSGWVCKKVDATIRAPAIQTAACFRSRRSRSDPSIGSPGPAGPSTA